MTLWERVVRLSHPAPPPLNTIGPPSLAITRVLTKTSHSVILAAKETKLPTPSSSPAGGDPAAVSVTRTNTVELKIIGMLKLIDKSQWRVNWTETSQSVISAGRRKCNY